MILGAYFGIDSSWVTSTISYAGFFFQEFGLYIVLLVGVLVFLAVVNAFKH